MKSYLSIHYYLLICSYFLIVLIELGYAKGEQLPDQTIIDAFQATFKELDTSMCVQYGMQAGACALVTYFSGTSIF